MATKEAKSLKVAKIAMRIGEENGKLYKTSDKNVAELMAIFMTKAVQVTDPDDVKRYVRAMVMAQKCAPAVIKVWTYFCMYSNWLSWGWHEVGETELSKAWADAWYELDEYSKDTLKGKDLSYYIETTD